MSIIISDGRFNKNKVRPWVWHPVLHSDLDKLRLRHNFATAALVRVALSEAFAAEVHAALARQQLPLLIIVDAESVRDLAAAQAWRGLALVAKETPAANVRNLGCTASRGYVDASKASGSKRSVFDLRAVTYEGGNCQAWGVATRMTSEFLSLFAACECRDSLRDSATLSLDCKSFRICPTSHSPTTSLSLDCRSFRICPTSHSPTTWSCRTCADLPILGSISCVSPTISGLADIASHSQ